MNIVNEIREKQNQIIAMVNVTFEELIRQVEEVVSEGRELSIEFESVYPITNATGFKGNKPIAVIIDNERSIAPTWKAVVRKVLEDVVQNETMKKRMFELRDKMLGRVRTRLSSNPNGMRSPLMICEELYIETHYDTETLMRFLLDILNEIQYDSNKIKVVIKSKRA